MATDIYEEVFKKEMENEELEPIERVQNAFNKASLAYVKTFPVWMRCNFLLNQIGAINEEDRKNINWEEINNILKTQNENYDFNIFEEVKSVEDLMKVRMDATTAEIPEMNEPYYERTCKTCNEKFFLTRGEIDSFLNKGLKIPGRCYCCRKGIEKPKPVEKKEEEPLKTAMQIALEKAGIR